MHYQYCFQAIEDGVMELFQKEMECNALLSDAAMAIKTEQDSYRFITDLIQFDFGTVFYQCVYMQAYIRDRIKTENSRTGPYQKTENNDYIHIYIQ